ncbi:LysR family transcriptional regulator [Acidovorax sp. NPDC077693]|uniref:LysR family transcriptional regulator n=1 Tax=unclassified Acidovorax TaxID=2684926 RepID=UPI0037CA813E
MTLDRLNAMRVFSRVVDQGSFAGAARTFNMSPPVITRLVAELEEHLGTRLINRTTRRIALTDAGENYLDRVRQILADIEDAEAQAGVATLEPRGHLRLLMPPAFAVHQLAKKLPEFRRRFPHVSIEVAATGPVSTVDDTFDVTIIASTQALSGDFIARPMALSEVIVSASPEYLDRRGRPETPNDLTEHDMIIPPSVRELNFRRSGGTEAVPSSDTVRLGMLRGALGTSHVDTMFAAAMAGMGVAGLPSFVIADALHDKALERVLPGWHMLTTTLYAAMPTRKYVPARTRAFMDYLVESFDGRGGTVDPWLRSGLAG